MAINNPASRLHDILKRCRTMQKERGKPMMVVWRQILGVAPDLEETMVMTLVGKIFLLPSQVTTEISQFADLDQRLYLGWKQDLAEALKKINFNSNFADFYDKLSDSLLLTIEFCAHELSKRRPEKVLDQASLDEIKEQVHSFYDSILAADIPADIRRFLLDHTYELIDAIDSYIITGAIPLQRALDSTIGSFLTDQETAKQIKNEEISKRFWEIMNKVAIVLNISKSALELGEGAAKLIGK